MELRQLRHLVEIVRCASFGKAATNLNITQPALSKSIKNLEDHLGVRLLERYPTGVEPNEYGQVFLDYVTLALTELDRAVEELKEMRGTGRGTIRVGVGTTILKYLMPLAVRRFLEQEGNDRILLRQGQRERLLPLLRLGEIDVMISSVERQLVDSDLHQEIVIEDKLAVVTDRGHPLSGRTGLSLKDLADYRWVLPDVSELEGDRLTTALKAAGLPPPDVVIRTGSSVFMAEILEGSHYLSYLPTALITLDKDFAHLIPLDVPPIWTEVYIGVTYRRRGALLMPTRRFINRLKEVGAELQARMA